MFHRNAKHIICLCSVHHENEELNQQVTKLQQENSDMKAKLATMSDDSEKLGGLKVRHRSNQNHQHRS
jgi:hypothetical protein